MAIFVKVNSFITEVVKGTHAGAINPPGTTDTLKVYLAATATSPSASADSIKTDIAEVATGNGYTGPVDITNTASQSGGTITVSAVDLNPMITATGAVSTFQYVVLYNDTPTSPVDPLWGWWDYGSALSLASGDTFTVDFQTSLATFA